MGFRSVMPVEDLWMGEKVGLDVAGKKLLLLNIDGQVSAFEDRCAHQGWPLSRGTLAGRELTCALHHWRYDACTGRGLNPAGVALRRYPVAIIDGRISVDVDADADVDVR